MTLFNFMRKIDKPMMNNALNLMQTDLMAIPQSEAALKFRQSLRRLRVFASLEANEETWMGC